ncbi:MAG: UDP-N-acetylmuramoyl-L-alanyl-D-glutamate--2,6-diaminopimelate ligase [Endomicrobium sp.]|jgi:UDP-N-acetylmuramoyl-L-alanyl-D-glutamate--2,6-diaminopimelate ligase|nr:UDP-N-acetylmuramoyl-L-alanyl-D-glutamate--2,6-diaminopimelate ligase [Endomicrobium sp.]
MKLKNLLQNETITVIGDDNIEISEISYDSRKISKNYAFFALPGHNTDGTKYISEAISRGASVIITNTKYDINSITQVIVEDIFHFMPIFCAKFYNYPDKELSIIGITGTNGKTTTTYMLESIFINSNIDCGVIGTINYRYKNKIINGDNTTPQALDIYRIMREMVNNSIKYLIMEVSSHALSLSRVYGIDFDIAVFTNLTQDHLDFHKNEDNYFEAKSVLFKRLGMYTKRNKKYAVINVDDPYGWKLSKTKINAEIGLYSTLEKNAADFKARNIIVTNKGSVFDLFFNNKKVKIKISHIGLHNIYNAIAAFAVATYCEIPMKKILKGLNNLRSIPGRLEKVDTRGMGFEVIIDYAHTSDAFRNVLQTLKNLKFKRIITVFGCGGNRDRAKRPLMGKIASEMSDFVFITSDNPRAEDPHQIILDIEVGIKKFSNNKENYKVVIDREIAIKEAVMMAIKNDIILITGKGHEIYQIIGTEKINFNDAEIAKKYIDIKKNKKTPLNQIKQKEFPF